MIKTDAKRRGMIGTVSGHKSAGGPRYSGPRIQLLHQRKSEVHYG